MATDSERPLPEGLTEIVAGTTLRAIWNNLAIRALVRELEERGLLSAAEFEARLHTVATDEMAQVAAPIVGEAQARFMQEAYRRGQAPPPDDRPRE